MAVLCLHPAWLLWGAVLHWPCESSRVAPMPSFVYVACAMLGPWAMESLPESAASGAVTAPCLGL